MEASAHGGCADSKRCGSGLIAKVLLYAEGVDLLVKRPELGNMFFDRIKEVAVQCLSLHVVPGRNRVRDLGMMVTPVLAEKGTRVLFAHSQQPGCERFPTKVNSVRFVP